MNDFINETKDDQIYTTENFELRVHRYAEAIECKILDNSVIGKYSSIRKSILKGYNSVGCHSYITSCEIGRYTTIGSRVSVGSFEHPTDWLSVSEFQYRDTLFCYGVKTKNYNMLSQNSSSTVIGNDVWIGDNVFIKKGITIGSGSIIGACSVVTKPVQEYSIIVGNPGRLLKKRFDDKTIKKLLESDWWDLDISELDKLNLNYQSIVECLKKIECYKRNKLQCYEN